MTTATQRGTMTNRGGRPRKYPAGTPLKRWIDRYHAGDYEAVALLLGGVQGSTIADYAAGHVLPSLRNAKKLKVLSGGILTLDYLMDADTFADFTLDPVL